MRLTLTLIATLLLLPFCAKAQNINLLTNTNFASGNLEPWIAEGVVSVGIINNAHSCSLGNDNGMGGKITQSFSANPVGTYYIDIAFSRIASTTEKSTVTVALEKDGIVYDSESRLAEKNAYGHIGVVMKNGGASTLSLSISNTFGRVDIFRTSVIELSKSKYEGLYSGSAVVHVDASADRSSDGLSVKGIQRAYAIVDEAGRIIVVRDLERFAAGIILPDGTLDMMASDERTIINANLKGKKLWFEVLLGNQQIRDQGDNFAVASTKVKFTLFKKEKKLGGRN